MKKYIFLGAAVFLLAAMCVGCGSIDTQQEEKERKELVLWSYYETETQQQGLNQLMEAFNAAQQDYAISWEYIPMSDYIKELTIAISKNSLPDLVLVDNPDMQSLVHIGLLADLTDELSDRLSKEDYYESVWSTAEYDGRIYGIPFCCNNTAIIYNKQMLTEAGIKPPETWEDFEAAAKALTTEGEEGHYGFAMSAASGEQGAFQFLPWLLSTGADGQNLKDERTAEAFWLVRRLLDNGCLPNDCINWSQTDVTRIFIAEKAAMVENGPWALPEIEQSGIDYGICPFPSHTSKGVIIGGENLAALEGKNVEGAAAFMEFYNQEQVMEEICGQMGNISPIRSAAMEFCSQNPEYQVFADQMEYGISRNSIQNWKKVCQVISESLYQLFGSGRSTEEIWQKYVREIAGRK